MASDEQPRVSVIITCYNLERYITLAIRSVLDQTRGAFEIIVVDDASTDQSVARISEFADRVMLVRLERNGGVLGATLAGIRAATGEVVAFLDGDDTWRIEKLARIIPAFANDPKLVLLSHDYAIVDGNGVATGAVDDTKRTTRKLVKRRLSPGAMSERLKDAILSYQGVWLGSAFSIRRTAIDLAEMERFITSVSIPRFRRLSYQDHLLAHFVIVTNPDGVVGFIDEVLFDYRIFLGNTSGLSTDRDAALRTLTRSYVNVVGTQMLLQAYPRHHRPMRRQALLGREFRYMTMLYSGRTIAALGLAGGLALTFWRPRRTVKEIARIGAAIVLGSDRFFDLKTARRFKEASDA